MSPEGNVDNVDSSADGPSKFTHVPVHLPLDRPTKVTYEDPRDKPRKARLVNDPAIARVDPGEISAEYDEMFKKWSVVEVPVNINGKLRLCRVLEKNDGAFAKGPYDLGECNCEPVSINTGTAKPIFAGPRKLSYHARQALKAELIELVRLGIIKRSKSAWASAIVLVNKKDGTKRLCIDFRPLNAVAERSSFPLPKIQDIFAVLNGKKWFSLIDIARGFWQIKVAEESRKKTAFNTPFGQFEFNRLPFGLNSAPGAFQAVMTEALADILWINCCVYIDDILVFTETYEEHLEALDQVLTRLRQANLKIKLSKCEFARTQLHYLGHVVNSQGLSADPKKVEAIREWKTPTCVKELEQFLGTANYYSKFIPDFSHTAAPLYALKKKRAKWLYGPQEDQAFQKLKAALCNTPVLRHPDFTRGFVLTTDASGYGLGATLSQEFDDGEHPICYASRTLHDEELRYPTIDRELLGVVWAIDHFDEYLDLAPFTVYTDHKPLISLLSKGSPAIRLYNLIQKLMEYRFTIMYKPGVSNVDADALSRYPRKELVGRRSKIVQTNESISNQFDPESKLSENSKLSTKVVRQRKERKKPALAPNAAHHSDSAEVAVTDGEAAEAGPAPNAIHYDDPKVVVTDSEAAGLTEVGDEFVSAEEALDLKIEHDEHAEPTASVNVIRAPPGQIDLQHATRLINERLGRLREDEFFGPIMSFVEHGTPPAIVHRNYAFYVATLQDYMLLGDGLFVMKKVGNTYEMLECVSKDMREYCLYNCHDVPAAAHGGIKATLMRVKTRYFWPTLAQDVRNYVNSCALCLAHKNPVATPRQRLGDIPPPRYAWQRLHMDVWSAGGEAEDGTRCVLAFIDAYTKYLITVPLVEHTAVAVTDAFLERVVMPLGLPAELVSDGGKEFVSKLQTQLYRALGVTRKVSSPYHPQANGQIENVFRSLRRMIATSAHNTPRNWSSYLAFVTYAYNNAYHQSIRNTPFYLMFGRDPTSNVLYETVAVNNREVSHRLTILKAARDDVLDQILRARERNRRYYDENARPQEYRVGEMCFLRANKIPKGSVTKLNPRYVGPFRITNRKHDTLYVVPVHNPNPNRDPRRIHVNHAKPCIANFIPNMRQMDLDLAFTEPVDPNLEAEDPE